MVNPSLTLLFTTFAALLCLMASISTALLTTVPLRRSPGFVLRTRALFSSTAASNKQQPASAASSSRRLREQTGGLRRLPVVTPSIELQNRARRHVFHVKADEAVRNAKKRAIKHGAERLNTLSQSLCVPLRDTINQYRFTLRNLHPFEQVVAELTVSNRQQKDGLSLEGVLSDIHESRKMILDACKDWIGKVKNAPTAREADVALQEGTDAVFQLFQSFADAPISGLVQLQKSLRTAPVVELDTPTMVLVGYPNVGKSSIVRALTNAAPEVNNYPFTTRGLTIGHCNIYWDDDSSSSTTQAHMSHDDRVDQTVCQIMDSPGLLYRADDERNAMEALTIASLQHLPTAVCFVVDLSVDDPGLLERQLQLRRDIRARFPKRPWIDVGSKCDLDWNTDAVTRMNEMSDQFIPVSTQDGSGIDELEGAVAQQLGKVQLVLTALAALKETEGSSP